MKLRNLAILAAIVFVAALAVSRVVAPSNPAPADTAADLAIRITAETVVSRNQSPVLVQLESGIIPPGIT